MFWLSASGRLMALAMAMADPHKNKRMEEDVVLHVGERGRHVPDAHGCCCVRFTPRPKTFFLTHFFFGITQDVTNL
jgi:hypothetical protein